MVIGFHVKVPLLVDLLAPLGHLLDVNDVDDVIMDAAVSSSRPTSSSLMRPMVTSTSVVAGASSFASSDFDLLNDIGLSMGVFEEVLIILLQIRKLNFLIGPHQWNRRRVFTFLVNFDGNFTSTRSLLQVGIL